MGRAVEHFGDWLVSVDRLAVFCGSGGVSVARLRVWRRDYGLGRAGRLHDLRRSTDLPGHRFAAPAGTGQGRKHWVLLPDGLEWRTQHTAAGAGGQDADFAKRDA